MIMAPQDFADYPDNKAANRCFVNAALQIIDTDRRYDTSQLESWITRNTRSDAHNPDAPLPMPPDILDRDLDSAAGETGCRIRRTTLDDLQTSAQETGNLCADLAQLRGYLDLSQQCTGEALDTLLDTLASESTIIKTQKDHPHVKRQSFGTADYPTTIQTCNSPARHKGPNAATDVQASIHRIRIRYFLLSFR